MTVEQDFPVALGFRAPGWKNACVSTGVGIQPLNLNS